MTESNLVDKIARAIYAISPAIQQWNGDPYEFTEPGARHEAEKARKQAMAVVPIFYPCIETQEALLDLPINALLIDDDGDVYATGEFAPVLLTGWSGVRYDPPALPAILIWSPEVQP